MIIYLIYNYLGTSQFRFSPYTIHVIGFGKEKHTGPAVQIATTVL